MHPLNRHLNFLINNKFKYKKPCLEILIKFSSWIMFQEHSNPNYWLCVGGDYFLLGLIFIKKIIIILNYKRNSESNQNRFKLTGFGLFWFFRIKTSSNWFGLIFSLTWFFSGLARFFFFSVRFDFFYFRLIKPKPNQTGRFFLKFQSVFFHDLILFIFWFF
jgi:hypothetical protein